MAALTQTRVITVEQAKAWGCEIISNLKLSGIDLTVEKVQEVVRAYFETLRLRELYGEKMGMAAGLFEGAEKLSPEERLKYAGELEEVQKEIPLAQKAFKETLAKYGITFEYENMNDFLRNR